MSLKALALALPLVVMSCGAAAQELEKNGLPCVPELCIGDSLQDLAKISWQPAQQRYKLNNKPVLTAERKLSEVESNVLQAAYPNVGAAAPYFFERQFDATAVPLLAQVAAACEVNELFGHFGGATGAPTRVGLSLAPSKSDPARQVWTVTTIVREFPSAKSNEERSEITAALAKRYWKFGGGNRIVETKPFEGRFMATGSSHFGFGLAMMRPTDELIRLKQHPSCTAAK